ncbi:MAG TPA: hypothetical protein VJP40_08560, partial [bacterium]|nr:hypothetical protein [bacterium]
MTSAPIRQILEAYPNTALAEAVGPWLLNLDENQNGSLEESEVQDERGRLRCDFRVQDLGGARWKKLESILLGRSLIGEKREGGCPMKPGKAPPRLPTASAGLYRSAAFDYVFQLGKGIGLQAVLDFLKDAGYPAQAIKNGYESTLASGRILRIETS